MKNGDMPAMAVALTDEQLNEYQNPMLVLNANRGLTKREYMATAIMQGIASTNEYTVDDAANLAVGYADALLAALEENNQ